MGNELSAFNDLCDRLGRGEVITSIDASDLPAEFNDDMAVRLAGSLSENPSSVQSLGLNTAFLTKRGTSALIKVLPRVPKISLTHGNTHSIIRSAVNAAVLLEALVDCRVKELTLRLTPLDYAEQSLQKLLANTRSLQVLRLVALPAIARDRYATICEGFKANTSLVKLELASVRDSWWSVLEGLHHHPTLQELECDFDLQPTNVSPLQAFLRANTTVKLLKLQRWHDSSLSTLTSALRRNPTVQTLVIHQSRLSRADTSALKQLLRGSPHLTALVVAASQLSRDGLRELAQGLYRNTTLETLDISDNDLSANEVLRDLLRRNRSLKQIVLGRNDFDLRIIGDALQRHVALQELSLSGMNLTDANVMRLGGIVRGSSLTGLDLANNHAISATGLRLMLEGGLGSISTLILYGNGRLGDEGGRVLGDFLRSDACCLNQLVVDDTRLGDEGLMCILAALRERDSLSFLSIEDNYFSPAVLEDLTVTLPQLRGLKRLDFTWNGDLPTSPPESFLNAFRDNKSLLNITMADLPAGSWMSNIRFYVQRNRYLPLVNDSGAPPSLWPLALAKHLTASPESASARYFILLDRLPWLLEHQVNSKSKRKAGELLAD